MDSHERFVNLLHKSFDANRGKRIRHLVRIVANAYSEDPEELKEYFENPNELVVGIATSAYHFLTGDIRPIQEKEYGGLGAIVNGSEKYLTFKKNQLWFSKLTNGALNHSILSELSLNFSVSDGSSLKSAVYF